MSMRLGKKITIKCSGPIAASKKYQSPWEDVWLSWTGKPGRTRYYCAPCLASKTEALSEHEINLECKKKYPENHWDEEIKESQNTLEEIASGKIYIADASDIPNIYSPKDYIDRAEAEKMIALVMYEVYGFDKIRCKWDRLKFMVIPM